MRVVSEDEADALESTRTLYRWGRRPLHFGGDDRLLRLFRKSAGHYEPRRVHESITITGKIAQTGATINHREKRRLGVFTDVANDFCAVVVCIHRVEYVAGITDKPAHVCNTAVARHDADVATLAVAWLLAHPARIMPVMGTNNLDRIARIGVAVGLQIDRETWFEIYTAAIGSEVP